MSAGLVVLMFFGGVFLLIVVASVVGARRGTPQVWAADDTDIERARGHITDGSDTGTHMSGPS